MKNCTLLILSFILLCSFKGEIPVNPKLFGVWRTTSTTKEGKFVERVLTIRQNKKINKFDLYYDRNEEGNPLATVKMTDPTHFKGMGSERVSSDSDIERNFTGYFTDSTLHIFEHVEQHHYLSNRVVSGDFVFVYRRWDVAKRIYPDFPNRKPTDVD